MIYAVLSTLRKRRINRIALISLFFFFLFATYDKISSSFVDSTFRFVNTRHTFMVGNLNFWLQLWIQLIILLMYISYIRDQTLLDYDIVAECAEIERVSFYRCRLCKWKFDERCWMNAHHDLDETFESQSRWRLLFSYVHSPAISPGIRRYRCHNDWSRDRARDDHANQTFGNVVSQRKLTLGLV